MSHAPEERASERAGPRLPDGALSDLLAELVELAGADRAADVLFRVGRAWGEREGRLERPSGEPLAPEGVLRAGVERLERSGLGSLRLDELRLSAGDRDCRIRVTVKGPERCVADGSSCGMALGYLTGFAGAVLDLDVVCEPFRCAGECGRAGCPFELSPAHTWQDRVGSAPPSGSARFFLHALGPSLGEVELSLAEMVENTGDALAFIDTQGTIRYWNHGAENMFGHRRDEVVGRVFHFLVPQDLLDQGEPAWIQRTVEAQGVLGNHITRRLRKDGTVLDVSLTRTLLKDRAGRVVGSTAILRDITPRVRAEEELRRMRDLALIGELASTVAHEIKNPLAGIYGAVQLLQRGLPEGDERETVLEDVKGEIRRLDQTVKDLLLFTRPLAPKRVDTDLATFLRELYASPGIAAAIAEHELVLEVERDLRVPLDLQLTASVLTNLAINAAQAMVEPGVLRVRAGREGDVVRILVEDTGPGIAEDELGSIFHPFFTTKVRGSGLGLSIARKNVEAQGGRIEVVSTSSAGTCFGIELPLRPAPAPSGPSGPPGSPGSRGLRFPAPPRPPRRGLPGSSGRGPRP